MKLCNTGTGVEISVRELVEISRRHLSPIYHYPTEKAEEKTPALTLNFELGGIHYTLFGTPRLDDENTILKTAALASGAKAPSAELIKQVRGELFILGYLHALQTEAMSVSLTARYVDTRGEIIKEDTEDVSLSLLTKFYNSCISALSEFGTPELTRVTERMPTLAAVKFPYSDIREGQSELVRSVYRSIAKGGELFVSAPTGTGKTVSVIYPAIRAIGDGRCERVFYLTPKTTTANAAKECLMLLAGRGAKIRAVRITAKEKICECRSVCRGDPRACARSQDEKKLADAARLLWKEALCVADADDIRRVARTCGVCPYELSLAYSELCEFIICDVNYVFDPSVYLRRYFDTERESALLVDEAHNLVTRAREMYSAELSTSELEALAEDGIQARLSREFTERLRELSHSLHSLLFPYLADNIRRGSDGADSSFDHLSYIPSELYTVIEELYSLTEGELMRQIRTGGEEKATRVALIKDFTHKISKLMTVAELFDDGFRLLIFLDGNNIKFKLLAIDTGEILKSRLSRLRAAVFFSATLEPENYYRDALGADSTSDTVSAKSPFDPSSLSVTIMDKISTRVSERERTKDAVCRVIAATLSARRGHYMVYTPSFEYAELLYRTFCAKYPKIKAILQTKGMTSAERQNFLSCFDEARESYLIGFSVMGGIYSEGIDLAGDSLIGAVVVGIGMPSISYEGEAIAEYYDGKLEEGRQYAYIYPGMNKVFQAAGRVIRRDDDRGVIVLVDDRFADPIYKKSIPDLWRGMRYCSDPKDLRVILDDFWRRVDGEK